jgi:hypothetical protein
MSATPAGGADAEVGRRKRHAHGRLAEVELSAMELVVGDRADDRDRGRRLRDMMRAVEDLGQLLQLSPVGDDDKVPGLPVLRGRRPAASLQDQIKIGVSDGPVLEGPDVTACGDGVPCLHERTVGGGPALRNPGAG